MLQAQKAFVQDPWNTLINKDVCAVAFVAEWYHGIV